MIERLAEPQLFDLTVDPGETNNLAQAHPETVASLSQRLEAARTELGDIDRTGRGARFFEAGPRKLEVPLTTAAKK
jgi:arylsulfatase